MKRRSRSATALRRAGLWLRPVAWLGLLALVYLALRLLFARSLGSAGLFSPSGLGDPAVLLLGLSAIVLRLALLFGGPAIIAYTLASRLLDVLVRRLRRPDEARDP